MRVSVELEQDATAAAEGSETVSKQAFQNHVPIQQVSSLQAVPLPAVPYQVLSHFSDSSIALLL